MKVLFYGRLAEAIAPELEVDARPGCSVAELRTMLAAEHPEAGPVLRSTRVRTCIGHAFVPDDYRLATADTVEFLSPVSGG